LAAGRPVLAIASTDTDLAKVVSKMELGWYCPPGESDEIAKAVARASGDKSGREVAGGNARRLACQAFDRPVVMEQFKDMLAEVAHGVSASPQIPECDTLMPMATASSRLL
jgi:glycosyltransferase involved in cell wall biosynthesis